MASHWLESTQVHKMPIMAEGLDLFLSEYGSTYPLNIAYKAAQIASPKLADRSLQPFIDKGQLVKKQARGQRKLQEREYWAEFLPIERCANYFIRGWSLDHPFLTCRSAYYCGDSDRR